MLYAVIKETQNFNRFKQEFCWHVGEPPINSLASNIKFVQADGDELEKILSLVKGIPTTTKAVQRWYGDDAKFIHFSLFGQ